MIIENETFVEIECTTAEQLIERLTETSPHFQGAEDVRLFRWESDISRPLVPSAFRQKELRILVLKQAFACLRTRLSFHISLGGVVGFARSLVSWTVNGIRFISEPCGLTHI